MKRAALGLLCLSAFWGCKAVPETSKYEAGDYVIYKYYGSYRPEPVILTEKILSKTGNKLEILVDWKSGKEGRSWKQVVTDTPFNQKNSIIDKLVRIENGKETELPNKDNLDLFKLYEGTYLMPQHSPRLINEEKKNLPVGNDNYLCRVRVYKTKVMGRHADMTVTDSEEFKWTNVSSSYKDSRGGLIYAVEVLEHGNRK
ncbi:MAG: hypothetical protein A2270_06470 [Elusimicrobia bacterium RIFOXYA12_FULL_51_18]|nr:MAG: hypothetical protein A2270_06470 [Elusimicrobia bacterium RIFOXYA12_FULL_51_18]OGS29429.1 MAG: hypothetical protein A2218_00290 [Elusimicrobia bacterium RIFOXYA2_FULL_53_38]